MTNATDTHHKLDKLIESLGLSYNATFIPQSKSRNAKEKHASLNWKVSIGKGTHASQQLETDYMQGIGHAKGYEQGFTMNGWQGKYFATVAEKGKALRVLPRLSDNRVDWYEANERIKLYGMRGSFCNDLTKPLLRDVLYALCMDADVLNYSSFEEWASNLGYDKDSRKGEAIYKQCLTIALKLRSILGDTKLTELQEAFSDY